MAKTAKKATSKKVAAKGTPRGPYKKRSADVPKQRAKTTVPASKIRLLELTVTPDFEELLLTRGARTLMSEKKTMEGFLRKMKVKEGFNIKDSWVKHVHDIVKDSKLEIYIKSFPVEGNPKFRRIVRLS